MISDDQKTIDRVAGFAMVSSFGSTTPIGHVHARVRQKWAEIKQKVVKAPREKLVWRDGKWVTRF